MLIVGIGEDGGAFLIHGNEELPIALSRLLHGLDCIIRRRSNRGIRQALLCVGIPRSLLLTGLIGGGQLNVFQAIVHSGVKLQAHWLVQTVKDNAGDLVEFTGGRLALHQGSGSEQLIRAQSDSLGAFFDLGLVVALGRARDEVFQNILGLHIGVQDVLAGSDKTLDALGVIAALINRFQSPLWRTQLSRISFRSDLF